MSINPLEASRLFNIFAMAIRICLRMVSVCLLNYFGAGKYWKPKTYSLKAMVFLRVLKRIFPGVSKAAHERCCYNFSR